MSDDFDAYIIAHLPEKLRSRTCPAGLPHTGDDPASDHGHTDCWFMQLAATEIEQSRSERSELTARAEAAEARLATLTGAIERLIPWAESYRMHHVVIALRGALDAAAAVSPTPDTDDPPYSPKWDPDWPGPEALEVADRIGTPVDLSDFDERGEM